jgi:SAM-dependent methyltransferase
MSPSGSRKDPYADIVALYDLEHDAFREDIDFYLQLAEVVGDPILELGCGTGRVIVPLAEAGWRVTGLDQSRAMLARAMERVDTSDVNDLVVLQERSMTDADVAPGGPFGLVLFTLNGFMHLHSSREQRRALEAAFRALDPRGMLVIDALNPTPDYLHGLDGRIAADGQWSSGNGKTVQRFSARTVSVSEQTIDTTLWYDVTDAHSQLQRHLTRFPLRYVTRSELELMLELAGFVEWQVYGSYDLDPFTDESERLIVMAEVTASTSPA